MKWNNISNGETDGFAVFYMKDGKLHAVALTQDQADMLDVSIFIPFADSKVCIANTITVKDGVIK